MSILKRISTTVFSKVDQWVGEIENHEALIQAAIAEQQKQIASAKMQLSKLQRREQDVTQKMEELKQKDTCWTERALQQAGVNEAQALACLQHRQSVREHIHKLNTVQGEYRCAAEKMTSDIARCNDELRATRQKYELMQARQSSADALNVVNASGGSPVTELTSSFDRWEVKITQEEMRIEDYDTVDSLEQDYLRTENEQQLRNELAELLQAQESKQTGENT